MIKPRRMSERTDIGLGRKLLAEIKEAKARARRKKMKKISHSTNNATVPIQDATAATP
jgi:hypothetical protein